MDLVTDSLSVTTRFMNDDDSDEADTPYGYHVVADEQPAEPVDAQTLTIQQMAATMVPAVSSTMERPCHSCGAYFAGRPDGEVRCPEHREAGRVDLVPLLAGWRVDPSNLSAEPETRCSPFSRSAPAMGECRWCGGQRTVNYLDECETCWGGGLRATGKDQKRSKPREERPYQVWDKVNDKATGKAIGDYHCPERRRRRRWQREWTRKRGGLVVARGIVVVEARYPWHTYADQLPARNGDKGYNRRLDHHRLNPEVGSGVFLRCLVCLRENPPDLRQDQVCRPCEKAWRDCGKPWDDSHDRYVARRRRTHWGESASDQGRYPVVLYTGISPQPNQSDYPRAS